MKPKQRLAELRSPLHFNADSLGCLRSRRSPPLPSPWDGGQGRGGCIFGSLYFYPQPVTFPGVAPCLPPADVQRARPPRSRRTAIRREVQGSSCFFLLFFFQRGSRVLICDREANEQMLHYAPTPHPHPPRISVSLSALPGLQRHVDMGIKWLVEAMREETDAVKGLGGGSTLGGVPEIGCCG